MENQDLRFWASALILLAALGYWAFFPRVKTFAIGECNFEATKIARTTGATRPDLGVFAACMAANGYRSDTEGFLLIAQDERLGDWETKSYEAYLSPSSWTAIWPWNVRRPTTYTVLPK